MKHAALPLLIAGLIASPLSHGQNQPYSSFIVFGDSLADSGQFPDAADPTNQFRFTNRAGPTYLPGEAYGQVSSMVLGSKLGFSSAHLGPSTSPVNQTLGIADGNNWAVGGYTTSQIYDSITKTSETVIPPYGDPAAGTVLRERTGYLPDLASRGLRADPNALYYLTGGGNDILLGLALNTASAQAAAGRLTDSARALEQAGARYIMVWMLPEVSNTPNVSGTPLAAPVSALVKDFNTELLKQLATVDAEIIPLNMPLIFSEVLANAGQFGFAADQNLLGTCFDDCLNQNSVYGVNGTSPDPSKLFFTDFVHPTVSLQQVIGDYAYSILAAPWEITLLPEMATGALRSHEDRLNAELQADWGQWQPVGKWRSFVSATGGEQDIEVYESSADGNSHNLDFGASYRLSDSWRAGLSAGFQSQDLEAGAADSDYKLDSYLATAFAEYQANRWWGRMSASGGYLDFDDLKRRFDLGITTRSEHGDTEGSIWALSGKTGYDIAEVSSKWHLSPFISASYSRAEVDGYSEEGTSASALSFDDQTRSSKRIGVGLQAAWAITSQTQVFAEAAREKELEDDTSEVDMSLNSVDTINFKLQGYTPDDHLNRATIGISHALTEGIKVRSSYSYRGTDSDDQQALSISLAVDI